MSPETREFIAGCVPAFAHAGFHVVANVSSTSAIPGENTTQLLLVNRATGDYAVLYGVVASNARSLALGIISQFRSGKRIATFSSRVVGYLPDDQTLLCRNFAWRGTGIRLAVWLACLEAHA